MLKRALQDTKDAKIGYAVKDLDLGIGADKEDPAAHNESTWIGTNAMGRSLMDHRARLRTKSKPARELV